MCIFLSCIDKSFPKPDIPFLEDENHDKDGDGFSENEGDCDDSNSQIYPGSAQFEPVTSCTPDYDNDGFGDAAATLPYDPGSDCDDNAPDINPFAIELCASPRHPDPLSR